MPVDNSRVQSGNRNDMRYGLLRLIPYVGMFALALLLWLPFGFKEMGLIEEILINAQLDAGHPLFFITPSSVMSLSRSRPFQMFSFSAAYALDHNSYQFYNIFMMLFFFGKMVVVYWLVLQFLPSKKLFAFVVGLLYMLYPADTGLFALRVMHAHSATLAYLLALYLLLQFRVQRGRKSWWALFGAGLMLIFSLGQYQIALGAAIVTPFVLLYFGRPYRRTAVAAVAWYASMAVILLYETWAGKQPGITAYEAALVPTSSFTREAIKSMLNAVLVGYERQISGWAAAFNKLNLLPLYWPYLVAALFVSVGVGWWLLRRSYNENHVQTVSRWRYLVLLLCGLVLFPIGVSTFLPLPYYRFNEFRTYLLAMLSSAFILSLVIYLLTRVVPRQRDVVFLGLALPFIGLGFMSAFEQHQYYVNASLEQQSILQQTVRQAPQLKPETSIVVLDQAGTLNKVYVFYKGAYLQTTLRYLYRDSTLLAGSCPYYGETPESENCQFGSTALTITGLHNVTLPYDHMLLFRNESDGQLKLITAEEAATLYRISGYNPQARIIGETLPYRMTTLFSCDPALSCYHEASNTSNDHPSTTFDLPQTDDIGFGWRETEFDENGDSFHWSVNTSPTVDVNLVDSADLILEFKVVRWLDEKVINSLKLSVNGQDIPLSFTSIKSGGRLYNATIPRGIAAGKSIRQLVFKLESQSPVPNAVGVSLGFTLYELHIRPS